MQVRIQVWQSAIELMKLTATIQYINVSYSCVYTCTVYIVLKLTVIIIRDYSSVIVDDHT